MNKRDEMDALKAEDGAYVGTGNLNANILFVGASPGQGGLPMEARAWDLFLKVLGGANISQEEIYITNLVPDVFGGAKKPSAVSVRKNWPRLCREIEIVDPYVVVTLGPAAAKALTKVKTRFASFARHPDSPFTFASTKGSAIDTVNRAGVVTFSPSGVLEKSQRLELKKGSDLHFMFLAFARAKDITNNYLELLGDEK